MQGVYLKLFMPQTAKHHGKLLYEWILEEAHKLGIGGGSAFRAIAGYGRHGRLHEEHFFELADELPVEVGFAAEADQVECLLKILQAENISVFYVRLPVEFGVTERG